MFYEIWKAWLDAWETRRIAVNGLFMSGMTLAIGGVFALARVMDPLLVPFVAVLGFFVWLWWFSMCIHFEIQQQHPTLRFHTTLTQDSRAMVVWKFTLPAFLSILALALGGLQSVFPSALGLLLLFPLQWAGAILLLLILPTSIAATVAQRLAQQPFSGNLPNLVAWSFRENPRVWGVLAHVTLAIVLSYYAFQLVLWMQPAAAHLWSYTLWGSSFGQTPSSGHASVAALHIGILLALFPLQGHLVVFVARLAGFKPGSSHQ